MCNEKGYTQKIEEEDGKTLQTPSIKYIFDTIRKWPEA